MTASWRYILGFLVLIAVTIWLAVAVYPEPKLHLIACDVGQGDAILAVYGKTQILIDGGPDSKVLDCLSRHLPFWDREIEIVVLTHPQKDHFGGLIEVFRQYEVQVFLATQLDSSSQGYQVLKKQVGGSGVDVVSPTSGAVIRLDLLHLDVVWPSEALAKESQGGGVLGALTSSRNLNDFSIVAILRLGDFDALLTGDVGPKVIDEILATGLIEDVEYIKIPHHGSKNGLTKELLEASTPEVAVISVGEKNRYGHPHKEVLKLLSDQAIKTLRTDEIGDVEIITDGDKWWLAK